MSGEDPVIASFELTAEQCGDITTEVYERFYERCPTARQVMRHVDQHMQGRMLEEVLELLMTPPEDIEAGQLAFEVANHRSYGVSPDQYGPILEAVRDVVRAATADHWNERFAAAWETRLAALLERIETFDAASTALRVGR